jgi:acyl carrier protein
MVDNHPDPTLHASVRATVEGAIVDVVGQEFFEEYEVGLDSTFAEDLELESMEIVEIAEQLIEAYDGRVDFVAWFAEMELEDIIGLTVGQLVDFVTASLQRPALAAVPSGERPAADGVG